MNLEVVKFVSATPVEFVSFWSEQYRYDLEHLYAENIGLPLTQDRVWNLFKWKNGSEEIAAKKRKSIQTVYIQQLNNLPKLNTHQEGHDYLKTLSGGAIWAIFWLHCLNAQLFPIFDQHTYRAMARIEALPTKEIPGNRAEKIAAYFRLYIPFTQKFKDTSARELDRALFSYGRFLKRGLSGK